MESKAKLFGHALHPILIVFPLGLLATAVVFDVVYLVTETVTFATVAYWMIFAGLVGGFLAAPFGWIDWFAIPSGTRAKSVGLLHGLGNVVVLLLFIASCWIRQDTPAEPETHVPSTLALVFSFAGAALSLLTGWLGGELVERLGVGIDNGAHLDSPNSLSGRPASESASGK